MSCFIIVERWKGEECDHHPRGLTSDDTRFPIVYSVRRFYPGVFHTSNRFVPDTRTFYELQQQDQVYGYYLEKNFTMKTSVRGCYLFPTEEAAARYTYLYYDQK